GGASGGGGSITDLQVVGRIDPRARERRTQQSRAVVFAQREHARASRDVVEPHLVAITSEAPSQDAGGLAHKATSLAEAPGEGGARANALDAADDDEIVLRQRQWDADRAVRVRKGWVHRVIPIRCPSSPCQLWT